MSGDRSELDPTSTPIKQEPTPFTAWLVLLLILVINVPLFLCMPLTDDTAVYDLQAQTLLRGGVLYRDVFEPNLPGVVWLHAAVRSVVGWSVPAMRSADLFIFACVVGLLVWWLRATRRPTATQVWTSAVLLLFYLTASEWTHCQRDTWLLLPALAALHLRRRQIDRAAADSPTRHIIGWGVVEGLVWGAGVWLKPYIVIPAATCWVASAVMTRRPTRIVADLSGLLCGGLLAGGAGLAWMIGAGAWPHFWETFTNWNPRYFSAGREHWTTIRYLSMGYRFAPWMFLLAPAALTVLLIARRSLFVVRHGTEDHRAEAAELRVQALFAAFFVGWAAQAYLLQHLFDYVHAPLIVLCIALLAAAPMTLRAQPLWRPATIGFLVLAAVLSPAFKQERLGAWLPCVRNGASPENQQTLAQLAYPNWVDLHEVAEFLRAQGIRDGELTSVNNDLVHLFTMLKVAPSTKYVYYETLTVFFPERRQMILRELAASRQRFVVSDLVALGLDVERIGPIEPGQKLPDEFPAALRKRFPWRYPIVFQAGGLVVHEAPGNQLAVNR